MARKPRIEFPGAFYHVITRGNQRQPIFRDDADREYYLGRLEHYRQRYTATLYAYVLMANHVHLLLETGAFPLAKLLHGLQFTYTQYYNRRYRKVGHLFQGRYKAVLCDRDAYLLELVRYIHLNPARLHQPLDPFRYQWSSHAAYLGRPVPVTVETALILEQFHRQLGPARKAYQRFLTEGVPLGHQAHYYAVVDQRFLGEPDFVEAVQQRVGAKGEIALRGPAVAFPRLVDAVAQVYAVDPQALLCPGRRRAWVRARAMLVYWAREWGRMSTKELGHRLHRDPSMISRLYSAYATTRDMPGEMQLARILREKINTQA